MAAAAVLAAAGIGCQTKPPKQKTNLERALDALETEGVKAYEEGRFDRAVRLFRECETMARSTDNLTALANAFNNQAAVHLSTGNAGEARKALLNAASLNEALGLERALAVNLANLSAVETEAGNSGAAKAREYNEKAAKLFDRLGDAEGLILTANNEARLLNREGKANEARRLLEDLLDDARSGGQGRLEALILSNLAGLAEESRDFELALEYYRKAMDKHRSIEIFTGVARDLEATARILLLQGRKEEALENLLRAFDVVLLRVRFEPWMRESLAEIEKLLKSLKREEEIAELKKRVEEEIDRVKKEEARRKLEAIEPPVGENE